MNARLVGRSSASSPGSSALASAVRAAASALGSGLLVMALFVAGSMGAAAPQQHGKPARSQFTVGQYVEVARRPVHHKSVEYGFVAHVTNHGVAGRHRAWPVPCA